ncbi:hypothetical protein Q7P37_005343 [Cladosporium fusiforme]
MSFTSNSSREYHSRPTLIKGASSFATVSNCVGPPSSHGVEVMISGPKEGGLHRSGARRTTTKEIEDATNALIAGRKPVGCAADGAEAFHRSHKSTGHGNAGYASTSPAIGCKQSGPITNKDEVSIDRSYQSSIRSNAEIVPSSQTTKRKPVSLSIDSKHANQKSASDIPGIYGGVPDGKYSKSYAGEHSRFMEKFAELNNLRE